MYRSLKITALLLLTVLPAAAAMGQNSGQRNNDGSNQQDGSSRRRDRFNNGGSQDSSGYNRRDTSNQDFSNRSNGGNNGGGNSGFRNRDSGSQDSGSRDSSSGFGQSSFGSKPVTPAVTPSTSDVPRVAPKSSGAFVSKPLPAELAVLTTRSIFSRDHRAVAAPTDRPTTPIFRTDVAKLIFRGVMRENDHFIAFIEVEDSSGSRPAQWVGVGQMLTANGAQINEITLDHIVVEKSGTVRQILVGDNLDAGTRLPSPPVTASLVTTSGSPVASSTTGSDSSAGRARSSGGTLTGTPAVTASVTGTTSEEDVAEMMRRRRVQELGQ